MARLAKGYVGSGRVLPRPPLASSRARRTQWSGRGGGVARPPLEDFTALAKTIPSHFFTMDVALRTTGDWIIIELGDGQVSGLPDQADVKDFYRHLTERRQNSL